MVDSSFASRVAVLADAQVCHMIHCLSTTCRTCIYFLNRFSFSAASLFSLRLGGMSIPYKELGRSQRT